MMRFTLAAAALLAATATPASAAPIIYSSVQSVGASTATLSITTDGTIGSLRAANILSIAAKLTSGTSSVSLLRDFQNSGGNASTTLTAALRATASTLTLPYLPTASNNEFAIAGSGQSWYAAGQGSVYSLTSHQWVMIGGSGVTTPLNEDLVLGTAAVAGAVPEPATWGMMILGFGEVGASMRRWKSGSAGTAQVA